MTDRRFTEEEFAEILRRATEMQARLPVRTSDAAADTEGSSTGMALSDIRAIAAEVGIDPELITRAAALVADDSGAAEGTGAKWVLSRSSEGTLTDEDKLRVVRAIRDAAGTHGDADMAGVGLEWTTGSSEAARILVTLEPLDGRNEVRVSVDAGPLAVLPPLALGLTGTLIAALVGATIEPGIAAGIALVGGSTAAGIGLGRMVWHRMRAKVVDRSKKILAAATSALPTSFSGDDSGADSGHDA